MLNLADRPPAGPAPGARRKWRLLPPAPDSFLAAVPEHPLLAQALYNRGLRTPAEVADFLAADELRRDNPYKLADMPAAVQRIVAAIERQEIICVYGDFDADGVSATALMVTALQAAGGRVGPYIPDRVDEGYGLNVDAIERIAAQAKLIVTVDCGMRSVAEVARANELGVDVVITDHHSVGAALPPALAVVNPQRADCPSGFRRLAGVGVAYRLAQAVLRAVSQERWARISPDQAAELEALLLDYVALGTVADMMPLLGENRSLVRRGLALLNSPTPRPGVQALLARSDLRPGAVDATAISFRLGPRLNAAGRLAHAKLAYQLLRTQDPAQAYSLATELEALNTRRRALTVEAEATAEAQVAAQIERGAHLYVVQSTAFNPGIVGLVAGKLAERYYRPAVVIEQGESESRGSARSIAELDISGALDEVSEMLVRHGGHRRAAGFTARTERLPELCEALHEVARRQLCTHEDLRPTLDVDADAPYTALTWALHEQFARLEPTGQENPPPVLMCRGVRVRETRPVGGGKHLKLVVDGGPGSAVLDAIAFGHGGWAGRLSEHARIDLAFQIGVNEWNGRRMLQLTVEDLRPAV